MRGTRASERATSSPTRARTLSVDAARCGCLASSPAERHVRRISGGGERRNRSTCWPRRGSSAQLLATDGPASRTSRIGLPLKAALVPRSLSFRSPSCSSSVQYLACTRPGATERTLASRLAARFNYVGRPAARTVLALDPPSSSSPPACGYSPALPLDSMQADDLIVIKVRPFFGSQLRVQKTPS